MGEVVQNIAELLDTCRCHHEQGETIVLAHGCFDPPHSGHKVHLEAAKALGDILVVTVTADEYVSKQKGPTRPLIPEEMRVTLLAALDCVDYVSINRADTTIDILKNMRPDIYAKGVEYAGSDLRGERQIVEAYGGHVEFVDTPAMSATSLANEWYSGSVYSDMAVLWLEKFRAKYSLEQLLDMIDGLKKLRVMVIGELIIDRYKYVEVMDKAPKTTIIANKYLHHKDMLGGAAYIANTLAEFCGDVSYVTYRGIKGHTPQQLMQGQLFLEGKLHPRVRLQQWLLADRPTIVKERELEYSFPEQAHRVVLNELCYLDDRPMPSGAQKAMLDYLHEHVRGYDMVLVADYGHGLINRAIANILEREANFLAIYSQSNESNVPYNAITAKFVRADHVCINDREMHGTMRSKYGTLPSLIASMAKSMRVKYMTVTEGAKGCTVYSTHGGTFATVPIFTGKNPVDRIGAGDTFLSLTSLCAAAGYPADVIGFLGNVIGGIATRYVCTEHVVTKEEVWGFVKSLLK